MLSERTQPSETLVRQLPSGGSLASLFHRLFFIRHCCVRAAQHSSFFWIISSVQTRCLYCRFGSFLVRLTVTTDSFNLLSLLLLLALLFLALTLTFNTTIDTHLVDLAGSCLFSGVPIHLVYCSSWVDYSDCVSLLPLKLPHPQGACNWSFVHFWQY